jgi:cysteine synthase
MEDLTGLLSIRAIASGITLWAKREFENPGLSHKDRIAVGILSAAGARGDLTAPDGTKKTVVVASSGNTGNSIAWVGRALGYTVVVVTNRKCSTEKQRDITSKGATLLIAEDLYEPSVGKTPEQIAALPDTVRANLAKCTVTEAVAKKHGWHTPGAVFPYYTKNYMKIEVIMAEADPSYFAVEQYDNLDNFQAQHDTLGAEIYASTHGNKTVTHFVFTGSTGGTITGVGSYLKEKVGSPCDTPFEWFSRPSFPCPAVSTKSARAHAHTHTRARTRPHSLPIVSKSCPRSSIGNPN